ncbi:RagB/SusD family nutrient uptake outer membrane protein [Aquimarina intermedia]
MKKMKYIVKSAIFFMTMSVLFSCSDDFVDVASPDPNSEDFFNTEQEYQDALIGAYDLLQSTYLNVMLGEIASDNTIAGGESASDVPGIQEVDKMEHTSVNAQLRDIWNWMFAGINRANYIMEFQNKIDFSGKEQIIAQTRFLRAYYYFELVKWFGDVPLAIDKRILFGEESGIERTPKEVVYTQIEEDLLFAGANLPATQAEAGRVTSGAARALLGKVYLYQDKFSEAAAVLDQVIAGPYDLVADYNSIFEQEGENNIESVFEVQYDDNFPGAGFDCLQCSEGNVAVGFNGIRNYTGPLFESGFSFNLPRQEVVDAFETGDIRKDVAILDIEAWAEETGATYSIGYQTGFEVGHTGYYNRKYIARQGDLNTGDPNLTNPNNYRAIRFADVLLMAAEAHNRKSPSNDGQALIYLNRVRNRAQLPDVTATGNALTNAIYQERRVELVGEGHRFFDLVRTGRAAQEIEGFMTGKHEVFPIPLIEIQLAGNSWEQNPGY